MLYDLRIRMILPQPSCRLFTLTGHRPLLEQFQPNKVGFTPCYQLFQALDYCRSLSDNARLRKSQSPLVCFPRAQPTQSNPSDLFQSPGCSKTAKSRCYKLSHLVYCGVCRESWAPRYYSECPHCLEARIKEEQRKIKEEQEKQKEAKKKK